MKLRSPTYAEVASTLALVLALGTGGAYAADMITGKDIARNAVSSQHIKNGKVNIKDLSASIRTRLNSSGVAGPSGATGPAGPAGPVGPEGPRGVSAWDTIPSGVTIEGQEFAALRGTDGTINVSLPAAAPLPLTDATVNFAGSSRVTQDDDPSCTGTYREPSAPAGKVCVYADSVGRAQWAKASAWDDLGVSLQRRAFYVDFADAPTDVGYVWFTWAYTAP